MKLTQSAIIFFVAVLWWGTIAWVVVDYNFGFGTTVLRWSNPVHPTAAWHWDATVTAPATLAPSDGRWMRVTLPRGFVTGRLAVTTSQPNSLILRAETQANIPAVTQTTSGFDHELDIRWADLVARGRSFRFRVENPSMTEPAHIRFIQLTVRR